MFDIKKEVKALEPELIELRRYFHENPELGYEEFNTSEKVKEYLNALGLEDVKNVYKTGVSAVLRGTKGGDKTVMLRADMDALPVTEKTGLPFSSKNDGVMHACGHDGHTAIQLITAKILAEHRDEIAGNVKFVFQPNEENAGALDMINAGVLENPHVDGAFGLHLWSPVKSGRIGITVGPVLGTTEEFELEIIGSPGHTSTPHTGRDAVLGACSVVQAMQCLGTREFDPLLPIAIMFGFINGGTTDKPYLPDEMYHDVNLHISHGDYQTVFGLNVLPDYRHQGVAGKLVEFFTDLAQKRGKKGVILTCKEHLVGFYEKHGFQCFGEADSSHGGAKWYDMRNIF